MTERQIPPYSRPKNLDQLGRANARAIRRAQRRVLRALSMLTTPVAVGFPSPLRAGSRELRALNEVALALDAYAEEYAAGNGHTGHKAAEAMIRDALCDGPADSGPGSAPETVRLPSRPPPALGPSGPAHPYDMGPGMNQDGSPRSVPLDRAQLEIPVPAAVQLAPPVACPLKGEALQAWAEYEQGPPAAPPEVEPYRDSELPAVKPDVKRLAPPYPDVVAADHESALDMLEGPRPVELYVDDPRDDD